MSIIVGFGMLVSKICLYYVDAKGLIKAVIKLKAIRILHIQMIISIIFAY